MDPDWLLLLLPVAAASGWFAAKKSDFLFFRRRKIPSGYLQGINYLLNQQHDKAIELFIDMLEVDRETIEIHLTLGRLYRSRGEIERATLIHENLINRSDLTEGQKAQALLELGNDFYTAGILDRAERIFIQLASDKRYQEQANEILRDIYEQEKEWDKCIQVTTRLTRISSKSYAYRLAHYYCEKVEESVQVGDYDRAEEYLAHAIAIDSNSVRAILQIGRVQAIRGDHRGAIATWRTLEQKNPNYVSETVGLVTESYKAINATGELTEFLRMSAEKASSVPLAVAYVDLLESQNNDSVAENFLVNWIRKHPSLHCLHRLILLKVKGSEDKNLTSDFALIEHLIRHEFESIRRYECRQCGYSTKVLHWQCPGCRGWSTINVTSVQQFDNHPIQLEVDTPAH